MTNRRHIATLSVLAIVLFLLAGCGGGVGGDVSTGGGPGPGGGTGSAQVPVLNWSAPLAYTDNTPLNPLTDLESFEIYVKDTGSFTSADSPVAYISAIDPSTGRVTTSFNMASLEPFYPKGVLYHVALRAVAINGEKSGFSSPASFSF